MTREEALKRLSKRVRTCDSGGREREGILVSIDQDDQAYIRYPQYGVDDFMHIRYIQ